MEKSAGRILITGASGTIGSALVKSLLAEGHTVCAFDQSEDGLFNLAQEYKTKGDERLRLFLGNVRDKDRLLRAMEGVDRVFHCAALKHVGLSEYNPFEAMQTNIVGANNVIHAAIEAEIDRVVFTSSDKAVNPTSTMGATKLLGERLFTAANHSAGSHITRFASVRFGNVLNSNGSVLQIFKKQLERNQPLTITSTDMSRFFLSMSQAVDLCITAADKMFGGEIFVMNMGASNIMSLAKALSGSESPDIVVTGQIPGEKIYEELVTESEALRTVISENLYIVQPDTIDMLPVKIQEHYQTYKKLPLLNSPLRSDTTQQTDAEVRDMLSSLNLL